MHELVKIRTLSVAFACIVTHRATTSGFLPFLFIKLTPINTQNISSTTTHFPPTKYTNTNKQTRKKYMKRKKQPHIKG